MFLSAIHDTNNVMFLSSIHDTNNVMFVLIWLENKLVFNNNFYKKVNFMGTIKDLYDLSKELESNVSGRNTMELIIPILDKIKEAERENLEMERSQLELDRSHHNEMIELKSIHSKEVGDLRSIISNLESELHNIKSQKSNSITGAVKRG